MKKTMLLAMAAFSAMLALPAFASALPAHLNLTPSFEVHGGASALSRVGGGGTTGKTTTGSGKFENTTTGTVKLTFHGVQAGGGLLNCASTGEGHAQIAGGGTVTTTELPFHLVMLATEKPGILITPNNNHFATFTCGGNFIEAHVKGNGVLGEITSPKCGATSQTATLKFNGSEGVQTPQTYTGVNYSLESRLSTTGAYVQSAMNAEATITFVGPAPTLTCTH